MSTTPGSPGPPLLLEDDEDAPASPLEDELPVAPLLDDEDAPASPLEDELPKPPLLEEIEPPLLEAIELPLLEELESISLPSPPHPVSPATASAGPAKKESYRMGGRTRPRREDSLDVGNYRPK